MTYQPDYTLSQTLSKELLEHLTEEGLDALPEMIRIVINTAMQAERLKYLGVAAPYERSTERADQANGYKPKTLKTRVGEVTFAVPQVRDGDFYPQALEKGLRSERALTLALAEMYVQGVSTRKVAAITEKLCGTAVSSTQVSRASAQLDETLEGRRNRPPGECPYLILDARYEKVRQDGQVRDAAVLTVTAIGISRSGRRQLLGVSLSLSEGEVHWRAFLQSLISRSCQIAVGNAQAEEDAKTLSRMVHEKMNVVEEFSSELGPVICKHTGPGVLGFVYYPIEV